MPPMRGKMMGKGTAKKGTLSKLLKLLFKRYKWRIVLILLCAIYTVFGNLCSSIFANFITVAITTAINAPGGVQNPFTYVHPNGITAMGITLYTNVTVLLIVMACIYLVGIFASWWFNRDCGVMTQHYLNDFRKKMFDKMQDLPIKYFDTHPRGQIMSMYTNDVDTIRQLISQSLPNIFTTTLAVTFCLIAMLANSVWLTLVVLACAGFMLLNTMIIGGKSSKLFIKQQQQIGVVEGDIEESIKGLKVIKVFSHEKKSTEQFNKLNEELRDCSTKANVFGNITAPINGNIGNFMYILTATLGFMMLVIPGFNNLTLSGMKVVDLSNPESVNTFWGIIVSFLMMSRMFTNNINNLSQQVVFIVLGLAGASRCFEFLDEKKEDNDGYVTLVNIKKNSDGTFVETNENTRHYAWKHPHQADGTITYTELKGDIVLENVDFSYNGQKMVLKDVSVYAKPGQKIALVGATGAGKTTITNLINRFYPLADGKCRYDGININKIRKSDLRRSLGIVLQDTNLFSGTVMENIRYGRLDATDEEVYAAAKIANAYDFITRLPQGFNTMLSGDGSNLSQGQRQLLSIARAAVADAPVMILDEATSSIDTRTELLVQKGTDKLMEGRTVFIIAHRLSTIQNCDAIMVLDHGKIIERGNHESLIADKGTYYQLYTGAFELE